MKCNPYIKLATLCLVLTLSQAHLLIAMANYEIKNYPQIRTNLFTKNPNVALRKLLLNIRTRAVYEKDVIIKDKAYSGLQYQDNRNLLIDTVLQ